MLSPLLLVILHGDSLASIKLLLSLQPLHQHTPAEQPALRRRRVRRRSLRSAVAGPLRYQSIKK